MGRIARERHLESPKELNCFIQRAMKLHKGKLCLMNMDGPIL